MKAPRAIVLFYLAGLASCSSPGAVREEHGIAFPGAQKIDCAMEPKPGDGMERSGDVLSKENIRLCKVVHVESGCYVFVKESETAYFSATRVLRNDDVEVSTWWECETRAAAALVLQSRLEQVLKVGRARTLSVVIDRSGRRP